MNFLGARDDGTTAYTDALDGTQISSHFFGQSSFAQKAIVRAGCAVKVDRHLPLQTMCVLGCTLQTGAGTILNQLRPEKSSYLAVFGVGAVGMAAVLAARLTPDIKIIAVDRLDSKLEVATSLGATHTINSTDKDVVKEIHALTGDFGVERALDTTGRPDVIQAMLLATAPGGIAASVGAPKLGETMEIEPAIWITRGVSYVGVHQGSSRPLEVKKPWTNSQAARTILTIAQFLPRLIQLWKEGKMPVEKIITSYPYADIERAKLDLQNGTCVKAVLLWQ